MRLLPWGVLPLVLLCAAALVSAQPLGSVSLTGKPIPHSVLHQVLVLGEPVHEDAVDSRPPGQLLRLWAVPRAGSCIPDTEMICSHRYFLAVSAFGESETPFVYSLGEVGEIESVERLPVTPGCQDRLRLGVLNFPRSAFASNPRLVPARVSREVCVKRGEIQIFEAAA